MLMSNLNISNLGPAQAQDEVLDKEKDKYKEYEPIDEKKVQACQRLLETIDYLDKKIKTAQETLDKLIDAKSKIQAALKCEECDKYLPRIHHYRYKPTPVFYGEGKYHFGVELEVTGGDNPEKLAREITDWYQDEIVYCKHDRSIGWDEGVEIVTQPFTLSYHIDGFDWERIMKRIKFHKFNTESSCALHIHASRSDIHGNEPKIALLYARFWTQFLYFSRRDHDHIKKNMMPDFDWTWENYQFVCREWVKDHSESHQDRYYCVNFTNKNTVEFRLFQATTDTRVLFAALQLVSNVIDACNEQSFEWIRDCSFLDIARYHKYEELEWYLTELGGDKKWM